jgi:hypothetical protein
MKEIARKELRVPLAEMTEKICSRAQAIVAVVKWIATIEI